MISRIILLLILALMVLESHATITPDWQSIADSEDDQSLNVIPLTSKPAPRHLESAKPEQPRVELVKAEQQPKQDITRSLLVQVNDRINYTRKELECLAKNIFWEAGVEQDLGKYAVANVTINRLKTGAWGTDLCQVVYSHAQFSWTLTPRVWDNPPASGLQHSREIAVKVLNGIRVSALHNSLFYHASYVKPQWVDPSKRIAQIGQHIFYTTAKVKL